MAKLTWIPNIKLCFRLEVLGNTGLLTISSELPQDNILFCNPGLSLFSATAHFPSYTIPIPIDMDSWWFCHYFLDKNLIDLLPRTPDMRWMMTNCSWRKTTVWKASYSQSSVHYYWPIKLKSPRPSPSQIYNCHELSWILSWILSWTLSWILSWILSWNLLWFFHETWPTDVWL